MEFAHLAFVHKLLPWAEHLNWTPIAWLGVAAMPLFGMRILTIWFYVRRLREAAADNPGEDDPQTFARAQALFSTEQPIVQLAVSNLYFLFGLVFIGVALWGAVSTAWWMILVGVFIWYVVHWPFREVMQSWARFQNTWLVKRDADALLKLTVSIL